MIMFKIRLIAPIAIAKFNGVIESSYVKLFFSLSFTSISRLLLAKML